MNDQLKKTKRNEGLKPKELVRKLKDLRSKERSYSIFMNSSAIYGGEAYEIRSHLGFSPISFKNITPLSLSKKRTVVIAL